MRSLSLTFIIRKFLEALVTLFVIATLTFVALRALPGGPFDSEKALPPEIKANIEARYGLNDPMHVQYLRYIGGLVRGDWGESYKYVGRSVSDIIAETLPVSMQLGFLSLLMALAVGVPLGVLAASRQNSWVDTTAMLVAISGVALPSFVVGPVLVMIFSFGIPFSFLHGFLPPALWESWEYMILPVVTLGIRPAAILARMTRGAVLEAIRQDYVRTARAKGVAERSVLFSHVLRNSLIPVLTITGPLVAGLLSGSFIIEVIFAVPGIGKHLVASVTNRDYPLVLGLTLLYSAMLVVANLVVDILYSVVDPRIRVEK
ncbi:MAG: ABC transporter permease [Bdellovibrionaceae bacterium]|nr:ABC transporter permease [Pseudobdellovibrionaceae bacterium]